MEYVTRTPEQRTHECCASNALTGHTPSCEQTRAYYTAHLTGRPSQELRRAIQHAAEAAHNRLKENSS